MTDPAPPQVDAQAPPEPEEAELVVEKPSAENDEDQLPPLKPHPLFDTMAKYPLPFLLIIPIALFVLIGFGWSTDDKVETEVANIWIPQDGDYAKDVDYAKSVGKNDLTATSFAALAISRDGGNIMTESRLKEIEQRMQETEATTITHKGVTYTWDDLCAVNSSPYQFPCLRLTPMDLFKETTWDFNTFERVGWYRSIVQDLLLKPRLPRFGVMTQSCVAQCGRWLLARQTNPLALFGDIGNMEYNDPCKICIEETYEVTVQQIHAGLGPTFQVLAAELARYAQSLPDGDPQLPALQDQIQKLAELAGTVTRNDVVEFFGYYITRGLYAQLGASAYQQGYAQMTPLIQGCQANATALNLTCPPDLEVTEQQAQLHLLMHADNLEFSSVSTAGSALPFWEAGGGPMFAGTGSLKPTSGSGIAMSANLTSLAEYLDVLNYGQDTWNPEYTDYAVPGTPLWMQKVETNPTYAWFMASVTDADENTVCGNDGLQGSQTVSDQFNGLTAGAAAAATQEWCTPFDAPRTPGGTFSKLHFVKMWYDLLLASPGFLDISQGTDDPYTWTTGAGCGYTLGGERFSYTNKTKDDILLGASREVYNIDEGVSIGAVDRNILVGGATPPVGEYSQENPLTEVTVVQTLYAALVVKDIVKRVQNCNRPETLGGPQIITEDDAEAILYSWKETMENNWSRDWNTNKGDVQFVSFFDDGGGTVGSTGRMLEAITLDNTTLTFISIAVIAVFSAIFLVSSDVVESRVLITLVGVALAVCSFFAALGFGLLIGTKINVTIAWTLPFVIIGLGVDDVYIILLSLKQQPGYTQRDWKTAMAEVVVPVTMTSLVNACMFAIITLNDIPAVYLSAQIACFCIIALYLSVVFCYPAYCLLDFQRQEAGRKDILFCLKTSTESEQAHTKETSDFREVYLYDKFYKKIVLGKYQKAAHALIILISLGLLAVGSYGVTERRVGLGLEDFFPESNPASRWATYRTEELASWSVGINWGALDYTDPDTQMEMIGQFEGVVAGTHIAEIDTKQLWMADFAIWTSRHCAENFDREDFDSRECGRDQLFNEEGEDSFCANSWRENTHGLREKSFTDIADETCSPFEGGICRPGEQMHPADLLEMGLDEDAAFGNSYCPVISGWSDDKWQFCLRQWRNITGSNGRFVFEEDTASETSCAGVYNTDDKIKWPIPYSAGPTMFAFDLFSHEDTLRMMDETAVVCEDHPTLHCWMSGIPQDYWTQYIGIFDVLLELSGYATITGFGISLVFLLGSFLHEGYHCMKEIFIGSFVGALLIAVTIVCTLVPVIGLSILADVNLTGFSNMGFVLSVGFAVEYSVHIVSRWMRADDSMTTSFERVEHTMSFLMLPTFMSFVSSTIGVVCLAFTEFEFNSTFFFKPLIIVMFMSYWFGCWFLPVVLIYLDFGAVKLGPPVATEAGAKNLEDSDGSAAPVDTTGIADTSEGVPAKNAEEGVDEEITV